MVERSADGEDFKALYTRAALRNNDQKMQYNPLNLAHSMWQFLSGKGD